MHNNIKPQIACKALMESRENTYTLSLTFCIMCLFLFFPSYAHAGVQTSPLSDTICFVVGWFTGGLGKAIATLGIIVLGIGAMMGKVSWQMALIVSFGVSVMFSGATIVNLLTDRDASFCIGNNTLNAGYIEAVLCRVAELANRPTGQALGTLGICFLGVTALMGKLSAGLAILTSVGIGIMFKADDIVTALTEGFAGVQMAGCSPAVI